MIGDLRRTKDGEPLPGTAALEDVIEQMTSQANLLMKQADLLAVLRAELPELSPEAEAALALLVTGGGR